MIIEKVGLFIYLFRIYFRSYFNKVILQFVFPKYLIETTLDYC